jgi:hypothetical protein
MVTEEFFHQVHHLGKFGCGLDDGSNDTAHRQTLRNYWRLNFKQALGLIEGLSKILLVGSLK